MKSFTRYIKHTLKIGTTICAKELSYATYTRRSIISADARLLFFLHTRNLLSKGWGRIAIETLNFIVENGGVWHLWGHSWEIDDKNNWKKLENVLCQISWLKNAVVKMDNSQLAQLYLSKG